MSDLHDFVLNFCREMGGLVEPPAYGIYPVLWPDDLAERLQMEPYQRLFFNDGQTEPNDEAGVISLHYGHPFIEQIIAEVRRRPVWSYLAISEVRLDKRGLADMAGKSIALANARLQPLPRTDEQVAVGHYLRFNFKASLVTDEKQERLVTVLMHLQGGYPLANQAEVAQAATPGAVSPDLADLPAAPLGWTPPPVPKGLPAGHPPLTAAVLTGLLERAKAGAAQELAEPLEHLRRRSQRHLELDRARLEQYYTDLQADLERRLARASAERRPALEDKLVAVQAERHNKLLDIATRYELRLELELINLAVIAQPKVILPMQLENRHNSITRTVVWDPLLHRIEPLVCDVCGGPGYQLHLCANGHLAHKECLAPQCVDCKRVYCQQCGDELKNCVVCDRPVCSRSLTSCATCGRGTCQEHRGLCHAAAGEPLRPVVAVPSAPPPPPPVETAPSPVKPGKEAKSKSKARAKASAMVKPTAARRGPNTPKPATGQKIEVFIETTEPVVTAYVIKSGRELATRTWELTPQGLAIWCRCEKGAACPANQIVKRPETAGRIESQLQAEVNELRQEYQVAGNRVSFFHIFNNQPRPERRLLLRSRWKHEPTLAEAQAGFDREMQNYRQSR